MKNFSRRIFFDLIKKKIQLLDNSLLAMAAADEATARAWLRGVDLRSEKCVKFLGVCPMAWASYKGELQPKN